LPGGFGDFDPESNGDSGSCLQFDGMFVEGLSIVLVAIYGRRSFGMFWMVILYDFVPETWRYTEKLPQLEGKQRGGSGDHIEKQESFISKACGFHHQICTLW
jgi:hypothetical protein